MIEKIWRMSVEYYRDQFVEVGEIPPELREEGKLIKEEELKIGNKILTLRVYDFHKIPYVEVILKYWDLCMYHIIYSYP
jgi:hypothetical protein